MATLEQIHGRLKKLQAQAETLLANKAQAAIDQIRDIMLKHGLTMEDIEAKAASESTEGQPRCRQNESRPRRQGQSVPNYQHPKTGATWTAARPRSSLAR